MRRNSGIIGKKIATSTSDASGVHDLFDNYNYQIDDKWPQYKHYDNDDSSTYLYYEASGGSSSSWKGFKVRMNSTVTLPSS